MTAFRALLLGVVASFGGADLHAQGEAVPAPPAVAAAPVLRVAGLAVVRGGLEEGGQVYKPFGLDTGTRLSLIVVSQGVGFICFDPEASRLDSFVDDLGTNLLALSHRLQNPGFVPYACGTLSPGGAGYLEIMGGSVPVAGATRVVAKGLAVFRAASQKEISISPVTTLREGEDFRLGDRFRFGLVRWEKGGLGKGAAKASLAAEGDCRVISGFRFLDRDNKEVVSRGAGWGREERAGVPMSVFHFLLDSPPDACALEVTFWSDMRPMEVPFVVESGLGG